jgi:hypothetical protein
MADGVRIQPQAARLRAEGITDVAGRLFIVRDVSRPLTAPIDCHMCGEHQCKTYHLQLDGDGTVMVSTTIWERMQSMHDNGGFEKVNVVAEPPAQRLLLLPPGRHVTTWTPPKIEKE